MQAITVDHARNLLGGSASVLEAAYEVGLSGAGRLHDLFVSHEAMTPGDYKRRGEGLEMAYGFHASPFGEALLMATERGIAGLAFVNEDAGQTRAEALADMTQRWPKASYAERPQMTARHANVIFNAGKWNREQPVRLVMIGTDFDVRVWETLLKIPMGRSVSYADIARHIGQPSASRAVGSAVGRNPDLVRGALPSRPARRRQPRRLPLGPHPQARADRLGDGADGRRARCSKTAGRRLR